MVSASVYISPRGIELVPALGGSSRLLMADSARPRGLAIAPDGKSFAFASHDSIFAKPLDGGAPRLVHRGLGGAFLFLVAGWPLDCLRLGQPAVRQLQRPGELRAEQHLVSSGGRWRLRFG